MAMISNNILISDPFSRPVAWTQENLTQDNLNRRVVRIFQEIVADANRRIAAYPKDVNILGSGYWYTSDYYNALKTTGNKARLNTLRNSHAFCHGRPPAGFHHKSAENPDLSITGKEEFGYELKSSYTPSQGLDSFNTSLSFIDCAEAIQLAYYRMIREAAPKRFDELFSANSDTPMALMPEISNTPLFNFIEGKAYESADSMRLGEATFFQGVPSYNLKHLIGMGRGYHAMCIQDQGIRKYTAFGVSELGLTEAGFHQQIVDEFNLPPTYSEDAAPSSLITAMLLTLELEERKVRSELLTKTITVDLFDAVRSRFNTENPNRSTMGFTESAHFLRADKIASLLP